MRLPEEKGSFRSGWRAVTFTSASAIKKIVSISTGISLLKTEGTIYSMQTWMKCWPDRKKRLKIYFDNERLFWRGKKWVARQSIKIISLASIQMLSKHSFIVWHVTCISSHHLHSLTQITSDKNIQSPILGFSNIKPGASSKKLGLSWFIKTF